jgi:nucleotidyltransferase/DNA polymerase involved in DNA repair
MRGGSARLLSPVQANHRLYIDYHEHILKAVDTCLPVEKVCSIDEMACRLMGTERQVPIARELALNVKRALREQVGDCLTFSIGLAPNVFLGKVGSDIQKPDGLVVITKNNLPDILLGLELQDIYGIGERMEERLHRAGIFTVAEPLERDAVPVAPRVGRHNGLLFHQMLHGVDIQPPPSRFSKSIGHQHVLEPELRSNKDAHDFAQHLLTKAATCHLIVSDRTQSVPRVLTQASLSGEQVGHVYHRVDSTRANRWFYSQQDREQIRRRLLPRHHTRHCRGDRRGLHLYSGGRERDHRLQYIQHGGRGDWSDRRIGDLSCGRRSTGVLNRERRQGRCPKAICVGGKPVGSPSFGMASMIGRLLLQSRHWDRPVRIHAPWLVVRNVAA